MHSAQETSPRFQRPQPQSAGLPEPESAFEQICDEIAALVAGEHGLRRRAESAAEGLAVMVAHVLADMDEVRSARIRAEGIAEELSVLLAHERAERDKAEQEADAAIARAELEASWRRRFKAADRRRRREMLARGE